MKVKKSENYQNKNGPRDCKWSSLNVQGNEIHLYHPFWSWENSPVSLLALWGNKNGLPSMKVKMLENYLNKSGQNYCKWSSLNTQGTEIHLHHPFLELGELFSLIIGLLASSE